jgi:ubiquinone/menaquinone biosynthesis C-methylase UbiE
MQKLNKFLVLILQKLKIGSAIAPVLVKITGKHKDQIHPKHLIILERKEWYEPWIKNRDIVLDIGCGNGQRAIKIAKISKHVTGFDISKTCIDLAIKEATRLSIYNTNFYKGDAEQAFVEKDKSFDVVFFCDVIEHLKNDTQALLEAYRVLKNQGILLLIAPNIETRWKKIQKNAGLSFFSDPDHKREYTKKGLEKILIKSGFKILSISTVVYDTPLSGVIDVTGGISLNLYKKFSLWKLNYAKLHPEESIGFRISAQKI